jgi:hypothetical protein
MLSRSNDSWKIRRSVNFFKFCRYGRKGKRRVSDNVAELYELQSGAADDSDGEHAVKHISGSKVKTTADRQSLPSGRIMDDGVMSKLKAQDIRSAMNDWSSGSSSSSDSGSGSSSGEESDADGFGGVGGIAAAAASTIPEGHETRRLAVLHLDWDRISAKDIFAMLHVRNCFLRLASATHCLPSLYCAIFSPFPHFPLQSFLPPSRRLLSVAVYPSGWFSESTLVSMRSQCPPEFGKEQMAAERTSGPVVKQQPKSKKKSKESLITAGSSGADASADFDDDALRAYELSKLRQPHSHSPPILHFTSIVVVALGSKMTFVLADTITQLQNSTRRRLHLPCVLVKTVSVSFLRIRASFSACFDVVIMFCHTICS